MRICARCKEIKPYDGFVKSKSRKDGLHSYCKPCVSRMSKESRERDPRAYKEYCRKRNKSEKGKISLAKAKLKHRYGITQEDYFNMFIEQDGRCKICNTHQEGLTKKLGVDHCHESKKVRGLLCSNCNNMLGLVYDDINILISAIKYLKENG